MMAGMPVTGAGGLQTMTDQLTLSQPEGAGYAPPPHIIARPTPPRCLDLPTSLDGGNR